MRMHVATLLLLSTLLPTLAACAAPHAAEGAPSEGSDQAAAATEAGGDKAPEAGSETAAASSGAGEQPAAARSEPAEKKDGKPSKKEDDEEKKSKEQEKWDKTVEDLEQSKGYFTTWHSKEKLLLELDKKALGRPFLYFAALNSGAGGGIYRGAMLDDSPYLLHFERRGKKKVVLRAENLAYLDGDDARQNRVLGESITDGIVKAFDIEAELEDEGRLLVDLGDWFRSDNLELANRIGGKFSPAKDLSLFTSLKSFPRNVEVGVEMVFTGSRSRSNGNMTLADPRGTIVQVQHSLVAPPDTGYKPRLFDQRVGYFYTERKNLFDRESDDPVQRYISRWRLQKKDPTAEVSDPVQPIVYWVENSTPPEFRQAVKEGIEVWEPAFRKAGFSNAIVAKQMPDDADWDPADVRYAVVRWSEDENVGFAIGPSRVDPRTGEIFDADITMQANFINTYAERFEHYVAARDAMTKEDILQEFRESLEKTVPEGDDALKQCQMFGIERALQIATAQLMLPMVAPETDRLEFLQAMIREVTAHEVGHTLGLRHNFKSSVWRDIGEVHDPTQTAAAGIYGSFMEYAPPVIAPPGVEQGEFFQSVLGPYDYWAVEYGYREFGNGEPAGLRRIASRSHEPGLEYATDEDSFIGDAYATVWDMGKNPVDFAKQQIALAEWGFSQMLERAADKNDGFHKYSRYYQMFRFMYDRAYRGLDRFIGGYTFNRDVVGQEGGRDPIVPVEADIQRQALDLMVDSGLTWKGSVPDEQRLLLANKKFGSFGSWFDPWSFDPLPRIVNSSRFTALVPLMSVPLFERLESQQRFVKQGGLSVEEVADRVFGSVWPAAGNGRPDEHDLWLQSDYVNLTITALETDTTPRVTALFHDLLARAEARLKEYAASNDRTIAAHGRWLVDRIRRFRERQQIVQ